MSIHNKGRICYLNPWEVEESKRGIKPNCRNHRHISRAEAFELSGNPDYGKIVGWLTVGASRKLVACGYFVRIADRIEFTITKSEIELPFDQVRARGLELEKKLGIPFIERKVPLRIRQ